MKGSTQPLYHTCISGLEGARKGGCLKWHYVIMCIVIQLAIEADRVLRMIGFHVKDV